MLNKIKNNKDHNILKSSLIETLLGPILLIADENSLYFLGFNDEKNINKDIEKLKNTTQLDIISGENKIITSIKHELDDYFSGRLKKFKTPIAYIGTPFQIKVWKELEKIPHGQTQSYYDIATAIGSPKNFRGVGQANSANNLSIIIPCHRVINKNKQLGGYSGGLDRKIWLLNHERINL